MILMYHHVCPVESVPPSGERHSLEGWDYNLGPEDFEFQLESLLRRKFRFVTLDEYVKRAVELNHGSGRMVAVTFDDGWRDNYDHAFPVLTRMGIPATFFVVSGPMSGVADERRMTPAMLREMAAAGMEIGVHSRTHPNLTTLSKEQLDEEIGGCKTELEGMVGQPVRFLAYPGGRFNDAVVRCAQRHGILAACSVIPAGENNRAARYSLSRDVFTPRMNAMRDRILLLPGGRWLWRTAKGLL